MIRSAMGVRSATLISPSACQDNLACINPGCIPPAFPHRSVWPISVPGAPSARRTGIMDVVSSLPQVTGEVVYLAKTPEKPHVYTYDPPEGVAKTNIVPEAHTVPL